jgi:hypothetical protein
MKSMFNVSLFSLFYRDTEKCFGDNREAGTMRLPRIAGPLRRKDVIAKIVVGNMGGTCVVADPGRFRGVNTSSFTT